MEKIRRRLKNIFPKKEESFSDSFQGLCIATTVIVTIVFVTTQLVINFVLTPKGIELEDLSREKNLLVENNRELEQEIARIKSISIIKEVTEETMGLSSNPENEIIHITKDSIVAGR